MSSRDYLRLASQSAIQSALGKDAVILSSSPELFKKNNLINYDLAINTWLLAIRDFAPYSWTSVAVRIERDGLTAVVKYFGDAAAELLSTGNEITSYPLALNLYHEIIKHFEVRSLTTIHYSSVESPVGVFLFLARYLKRFTPLNADLLDKKAIQEFVQNQNRLKMIDRYGRNEFILNLVRDEVDHKLLNARTRGYSSIIMADIEITPGTCYDMSGTKCRSLAEKVRSLIHDYSYDQITTWRRSVWDYELGHTARLTTVPKTLSSARTIAPEECLRQAVAHRMFSLRQWELTGIDLSDQSVNQRFACEGSITDKWCTIDLSHASDDVAWTLVQDIYRDNPYYLSFLDRIRPSVIQVDGKDRILYSFATMGNSMTFLVESEIFWLITKAAIHFAQRHGVDCDDTVITYGDDIICASEAYPFVEAFLTKLGFAVNDRKSFYKGAFRESCGKDYLDGNDVSSPYFPRRPLGTLLDWFRDKSNNLVTVAESLISLQHRLFEISPISAQYIELYLREMKDGMGTEPVGALSTDIWGLDVTCSKITYAPEWQRKMISTTPKWVFRNGIWKYSLNHYTYAKVIIKDEAHIREYQLHPVVEIGEGSLPDSILYLQYLAHGPVYQSVLDRSLGISTSRRSLPAGRPRSAWRLEER